MFTARLFSLFVLAGVASAELNARQEFSRTVFGNMESASTFGFIGSFKEFKTQLNFNFTASYERGITVDEVWTASPAFFSAESFEGEWAFEGTIGPERVELECVDGSCNIRGFLKKPIEESYDVRGTGEWAS